LTRIDAKSFWRTLGERAVGATVVTVDGADGPAGFLGLSATHVTADPPTMLVSIDKRTSALAQVLARKHFAVNFLPREAEALVETFGGRSGVGGAARFEPGRWSTLTTGAPVYADALGVFDCELEDSMDRGSVVLVVGRVVDALAKGEGQPLILFRGSVLRP
jgi:flavin reductase (DIM6/NTAB) family NADH-FMN oxidoreductase RutF